MTVLLMIVSLLKLLLLNDGGSDGGGSDDPSGADGGGSGSQDGDADGSSSGTGGGDGDRGYPANTPVEEMTADQQAAYWRDQSRKHEGRNKALLQLGGGSVDELKRLAEAGRAAEEAKLTPAEKALEAAREEGRKAAISDANSRVVEGLIRAAASSGTISSEQADSVLDVLDRSRFFTEDGQDVDTDKVAKFIGTLTPARGNGEGSGQRFDLGQGRRSGGGTPSKSELGRAEAERRFGKKQTA